MGTNSSKLARKLPESDQSQEEEQGSIPSTPILTPKVYKENLKKENLDPRSPSKHIARTPIELLTAAATKLETLSLATSNDNLTVTPLKYNTLLGIDPRSPTVEFQRTPIVISASPDKKVPAQIRNKNFDNVLKNNLPSTPNPKIIPPKLLETNPVTPKIKPDGYKRKSFVLLETNIDFTETDLDNVIQEKYLGKSLQNVCTSEEISYTEIMDPRSPTVEFFRTPLQVCKNSDSSDGINSEFLEEITATEAKHNGDSLHVLSLIDDDKQTENTDMLLASVDKEDPVSLICEEAGPINDTAIEVNPNIEIEPQNNDELPDPEHKLDMPNIELNEPSIQNEEVITASPERLRFLETQEELRPIENQDLLLTGSAPITPPSKKSESPQKSKSLPVTPPLINLTADVKELDKKLTHLIYEDQDLIVCPRIVKVKDQNRTPLGLRNGNDNKKSTQKLKVSDKPRKAEYAVSKIPVFKEKKIKVQCENTPPRGMRGHMPRKSQWDAKDDTLVI